MPVFPVTNTRPLDRLPQPSQRGRRRVAGIDLSKPRMRAVSEAVVALAANPTGFTLAELAARTQAVWPNHPYTVRHAAYDIAKLRGKRFVHRISKLEFRNSNCPYLSAAAQCVFCCCQ